MNFLLILIPIAFLLKLGGSGFNYYYFFLLPMALMGFFAKKDCFQDLFQNIIPSDKIRTKSHILLYFLPLLFIVAILSKPNWTISEPTFSSRLATFFYLFSGILAILSSLKKHTGLIIIMTTVAFSTGLVFEVIATTPPPIDVWYILQESIDHIVNGVFPYTAKITNIYHPDSYMGKLYAQVNYTPRLTYFPTVLYFIFPFKLLFHDVRFAFIFFHGVNALLLYCLNKGKTFAPLPSLLYLTFPAITFIIRQSWIDPISLFIFFLAILLLKNKNIRLSFISLGIFTACKKYNLIATGFILVYLWREFPIKNNLKNILYLVAGFIVPFIPFVFWNYNGLLNNLFVLHPFSMPRLDSISIYSWFALTAKVSLYHHLSTISLILIFLIFLYLNFKKQLSLKLTLTFISFAYLTFFAFATVSFYNYIWFSLLGIWPILLLNQEQTAKSNIDDLMGYLKIGDWFFLATRIYIIFSLRPILSDVFHYFYLSSQYFMDKMPYTDFVFEYPPLAYLFMLFPRIFFDFAKEQFFFYRLLFMLLMFLFDLLTYLHIKKHYKNDYMIKPHFFYSLYGLLICPLLYDRFDIVIGYLILISLRPLSNLSSITLKSIILALGGFVKLVPWLLVPIVYLQHSIKFFSDLKKSLAFLGTFFGLILLGFVLVWNFAGDKIWIFTSYHYERGIQIESLYASMAFLWNWLFEGNFSDLKVVSNFGSQNLTFTGESIFITIIPFLLISFYLLSLFLAYKKRTINNSLLKVSLLMLMGFIIFNKVLSPQFIIWIIPLFSIIQIGSKRLIKWSQFLFIMMLLLSLINFINYWNLVNFFGNAVFLLIIRNLIFIILMVLLLIDILSKNPDSFKENVLKEAE